MAVVAPRLPGTRAGRVSPEVVQRTNRSRRLPLLPTIEVRVVTEHVATVQMRAKGHQPVVVDVTPTAARRPPSSAGAAPTLERGDVGQS